MLWCVCLYDKWLIFLQCAGGWVGKGKHFCRLFSTLSHCEHCTLSSHGSSFARDTGSHLQQANQHRARYVCVYKRLENHCIEEHHNMLILRLGIILRLEQHMSVYGDCLWHWLSVVCCVQWGTSGTRCVTGPESCTTTQQQVYITAADQETVCVYIVTLLLTFCSLEVGAMVIEKVSDKG